MRVKMSKPPPPAPTASAIGPCPTVIKIVGRPGTGSLPSTIAPPDHPRQGLGFRKTTLNPSISLLNTELSELRNIVSLRQPEVSVEKKISW